MVDYFGYIKKSFEDIFRNPTIILPLIIGIILLGILALLLVAEFFGILVGTGVTASPFMISNVVSIITSLKFIFTVCTLLLIDLLLLILIQSFIKAMLIGMYQDIVKDGKASSRNMFKHGAEKFKTCLGVSLYKAVIFLLPLLLLVLFNVYVFFKISKIATIGTVTLSLIFYLVYAMIFGILLFFTDPIIATEKTSAFSILRKSSRYAKEHFSHVMLAILSLFLVGICAMIFFVILDLPETVFDGLKDKIIISIPVVIIITSIIVFLNIVKFIIQIYIKLSTDLFVFYCYDAERPATKEMRAAKSPKRISKARSNIKPKKRKAQPKKGR